jgi:GAF domain-containing protein
LNALLKISRIVHAIRDLNDLQGQLLDLIFEVVPAGRGAILLADRDGHEFNSTFARMRANAVGQGEPHGRATGFRAGNCHAGQ